MNSITLKLQYKRYSIHNTQYTILHKKSACDKLPKEIQSIGEKQKFPV